MISAFMSAVTSLGLFAFVLGQQAGEVPGAAWLTAGAGGLALVAIAQSVRAISKTESEKTQVVEALQSELREAHEEIRQLHGMMRDRLGPN